MNPLSQLPASRASNVNSVLEYELDPVTGKWVSKSVSTWLVSMDYDVSNNPIYIGYAPPGTAKSTAGWQIRKLTFDGNNNCTDIQWAGGSNQFNQVWNNRASLSYS